ncbi:MAG: hypothetical protein SGARI_004618 [Bacillariaceae sp.]
MHRDVKPENIMLHGNTVKLGDFSLARRVQESGGGRLPNVNDPIYANASGKMTTYVATRWYRAPELLRADEYYSTPVDIFALGCVAAELHLLTPLFQGKDDADQLRLMSSP